MESTSLTTYDTDLIKKARRAAGTIMNPNKINYIKVAYNEETIPRGNFIAKIWNEEKETYDTEDIGPKFAATILVYSKKANQWDPQAEENLYESSEFFDYNERIGLVSNGQLIDSGIYRELKRRYNDLKLQLVLYVAVKNRIFCLFIKGSTIIDFGDYERSIIDDRGSIQQIKTVFTTSKEQNGSVEYFKIHFNRGEANDLQKTYEISTKVNEAIQLRRKNFAHKYIEDNKETSQNIPIGNAQAIEGYQEGETNSSDEDNLPTDLPF